MAGDHAIDQGKVQVAGKTRELRAPQGFHAVSPFPDGPVPWLTWSLVAAPFFLKTQRPRCLRNVAFFNAGNDLHSHTLSRAVPSALRGLTSVFGKGTGGSPAV